MRVLLDTDVLLDVALKRESFLFASQEVLRWAEGEPGQACVAWHTLSNIAYLTVKPREFIRQLLKFVEVAEVGTKEARQAADLPMSDFEDALQVAAALAFGASFVVTRNVHDFRKSPVPGLAPADFLVHLRKPK